MLNSIIISTILYTVYNGNLFYACRSVFSVTDKQVLSFRLHGSLKKYIIKIINNDNMIETKCGLPYSVSCTVEPNQVTQ